MPEGLLSRAKPGINEQLKDRIEEQHDLKGKVSRTQCYVGSDDRSDIAVYVTANSQPLHIEVKYVYDCAQHKQYRTLIPADSRKPLDYQIVFFATLPYYSYPAGVWYKTKRYEERKAMVKVIGLQKQYVKLCKFLRPADRPNEPPYCVDLPHGTPRLTEDCIRSRFRDADVCQPDKSWEFVASRDFKDAQVGFAIWDWSRKHDVSSFSQEIIAANQSWTERRTS